MPPRVFSRHFYCVGFKDANGPEDVADRIQLNDRVPYTYRSFPDNVEHLIQEGENLFNLASRYFSGFDNPAQFWWVIADFQPDPILDPTIALKIGEMLIIPSTLTLTTRIFNETRRTEAEL